MFVHTPAYSGGFACAAKRQTFSANFEVGRQNGKQFSEWMKDSFMLFRGDFHTIIFLR